MKFRQVKFRYVLLLVLTVATGRGLSVGQTDCAISQATFDSDAQYLKRSSPTLVHIMPSRYVDLRRTSRGFLCSGVPLVAFDGLLYRPVGWQDDPGLYLIVAGVGRFLDLSVDRATDAILLGLVLLCSAFGLVGFLMTATTLVGRRVGIAAFALLTVVELLASDVYALGTAAAVACIPWILLFMSRKKITWGMLVTMVGVGGLAETSNFIRSHSETALVLFALIVILALYQVSLTGRIALASILLASMAFPLLLFQHLSSERDLFLHQQPNSVIQSARGHVFWHSVYIGFGFIKNSDVPAYRDEVARAKVHELRPEAQFCSPEYEQVLKGQVFSLAKRRPLLVAGTLILKLLVVALICTLAANLGLYAAIIARKPVAFEIAFWLAIAFNALPGILVMPKVNYVLGLVAFAVIYAAYSLEYAARKPEVADRLRWLQILLFAEPRRAAVSA